MTDLTITPTAADRVAALRARRDEVPVARRGRQRPAQAAKILTAGLASTAVLTLTAAYGWTAGATDSGAGTVDGSASTPQAVEGVPVISSPGLVIVDPSTGQVLGAVAPGTLPAVIDGTTGQPIAGSVAPALPAVASQVVVPVPVPAAAPVPAAPRSTSQASTSGS